MTTPKLIKAGIVLDAWKLPVFEKHLTDAGFTFIQTPGPKPDSLILSVETETPIALQKVATEANNECAKKRMH